VPVTFLSEATRGPELSSRFWAEKKPYNLMEAFTHKQHRTFRRSRTGSWQHFAFFYYLTDSVSAGLNDLAHSDTDPGDENLNQTHAEAS
jgi:hypothetical protein